MGILPVHLTIDVEAAEARRRRGLLVPPLGYEPRVWGRFRNQNDELGLRRLARDLKSRRLKATFYVEPLGARYFGLEGLRAIVACLYEHGQDVQLHLHPTQRDPEALLRGDPAPDDNMSAYPVEEQQQMLREGADMLVDAGVPRERLVAFRAGNFGASNDTWHACRAAGFRLSSNYDPGYFDVACSMRHDAARPDLFEPVEGLLELPISCVRTSRGGLRHLQVTALSALEMLAALEAMRACHYAAATIVSHSFELYSIVDRDGTKGKPSLVNAWRWRRLLEFLERYADRFRTETAFDLVERIGNHGPVLEVEPPVPHTPPLYELLRFGEQALKRIEPWMPLSLPRPWRSA
jgi:hypothetical protein